MARPDTEDLDEAMNFAGTQRPIDYHRRLPNGAYAEEVPHSSEFYPRYDVISPRQFRTIVHNYNRMWHAATPEQRRKGREFYPKAYDLATHLQHQVGGISHLAASGMVAALSPNEDWEQNVAGAKMLTSLTPEEWDVIHRSAGPEGAKPHARSPEATALLKGTPLAGAYDNQLVKAHRLMNGEDVNDVIRRHTSPKTHSFTRNIEDPEGKDPSLFVDVPSTNPGRRQNPSPEDYYHDRRHDRARLTIVRAAPGTIDFHGHDIGINRMYPSNYTGRGLDSADLPTSKIQHTKAGRIAARFGDRTRYEDFQEAMRAAAMANDVEHLPAFQGGLWFAGKGISEGGRSRGQDRRGQRYF